MSFNHRFPEIPALDTAALVTLMRDPQKAAELWDRYTKARAEYDGLRASIAAENAKLNERLVVVEAGEKTLANDRLVFDSQVAKFKSEVAVWEQKRNAVEAQLADRSLALDSKSAALNSNAKALEVQAAARQKELDSRFDAVQSREHWVGTASAELAKREEAVTKREETATKLAALLKGV
jgi:chromosome segregation ATPase